MQVDPMPIGRFSRLTGLSVKALRHYDELGLLRPAAVDPETGYRSYGPEQAERAEWIRRLRRLELPLDEIALLLDTRDGETLRRVLVGHQRRTAIRSAELKRTLQTLQPLIDGKEPLMGRTVDAVDHRRLGVDLFNKTWTLMEKPTRVREEDDEMIHCAHASAYHWLQVGTNANRARSEWQCARVYSILGRVEPALWHARRCFELVQTHPDEMADWDLAGAYEAVARAELVAGNREAAAQAAAAGREACARIAEPEDRRHIEADLTSLPV